MISTVYKTVFLILFLTAAVVRAIGVRQSRGWWRDKSRILKGNPGKLDTLLLIPVFFGMQALPLCHIFSSWFGFADWKLPLFLHHGTGLLGTAVFLGAIAVLARSHKDLGGHFTPRLQIRADHSLVTSGIYCRIRHPMYAAHWLWALGQMFLLQNWLVGPAMILTFLPFHIHRLPREEKMMISHFGDLYREYMRRTGRILPRLRAERMNT